MEYRVLGSSGFKVPVLGFGAGTFGGKGPLFGAWGNTNIEEAKRIIDLCLDAGVNSLTQRTHIRTGRPRRFLVRL